MNAPKRTRDARNWRDLVTPFEHADARCAWQQVAATLGLLAVGLYCTYLSLAPYWVTLLLALPTAAFLIRTFMLMHACAHGSLFPSRRANEVLGFIAGVLTRRLTRCGAGPCGADHASAGTLTGGAMAMQALTVASTARSRWGRVKYRLYRHPLVMLGLGPLHLAVGHGGKTRVARPLGIAARSQNRAHRDRPRRASIVGGGW